MTTALDQLFCDSTAQGVDLDIADVAGVRGEFLGKSLGTQIHPDPDDHGAGAVVAVADKLGQDARRFFAVHIDIVDPLDLRIDAAQRADGFTNRNGGGAGDLLHVCRGCGQGKGEGHVQPGVLGGVKAVAAPASTGGLVGRRVKADAVISSALRLIIVESMLSYSRIVTGSEQ